MRWVDLAVVAAYLAGVTWLGARFRGSQRTLKDYFLGGRTAPWWAIALSIVAAETSTLTVIGTPPLSFQGDFGFLQLVLGYLLARIAISVLFLPAYFRGELFTAYELMRRRFGERVRKLTAATFLVLRALAEGVRVFAISIVISIVLGTGETASIAVILCLTLFYTYEGGMQAVIWTDVAQMALYVGGALLSLGAILREIPGGWGQVVAIVQPLGKFRVFDFRLGPPAVFFARNYSFWAGVLGGFFLTTASHGTDQLMVQRLLAARNQRESRTALLSSWVLVAAQFTLFLAIGACLFALYQLRHLQPPAVMDRIYPLFVWNGLPPGVAGLVMAAILAAAMSNLSAALNALASTTVIDFLRPARAAAKTGTGPERPSSRPQTTGHPAAAGSKPLAHARGSEGVSEPRPQGSVPWACGPPMAMKNTPASNAGRIWRGAGRVFQRSVPWACGPPMAMKNTPASNAGRIWRGVGRVFQRSVPWACGPPMAMKNTPASNAGRIWRGVGRVFQRSVPWACGPPMAMKNTPASNAGRIWRGVGRVFQRSVPWACGPPMAMKNTPAANAGRIWRGVGRVFQRSGIRELAQPGTNSQDSVALARIVTLVWGAVLFGVAMLARNWGNVLQAGLSIASVLYGSLLGVFLLGVLTRRVGQTAAIFGMAAGLALMLYVKFQTPIAFTWYVPIGTSATFLAGLAASLFWRNDRAKS